MSLKKYTPFLTTWIVPMIVLLGINVAFLSPAYIKGDILDQDDIKLGYAKSKETREYRDETGQEALWTNAMFSGMPTTQISTEYGGNIFEYISAAVRTIGGRTSSTYIIFYLMIAAFIGLRGMGVHHWLSAIGGFAYGYSGFFIIGYAAGHNAKVNTAAFIPLMILALLLILEKKNWRAFILMSLFAGLSIHRNHLQITYYAALFMGIIWLTYLIKYARDKALPEFGKYTALLLLAGVLAIGPNIANIWSTKVYTEESMRGGKSELTQKNQNQGEGGLSYEYAMSWSAGIYETVALIIPDAAGGGVKVDYEKKDLDTWKALTNGRKLRKSEKEQLNGFMGYAQDGNPKMNIPATGLMKWTGESMGNGAYYVGASIFFLFCLAFFTVGGSIRQWVIASIVLFSFMGWGSNMDWFNSLLFDYLPLYNKFRVPSMAMVVLFFLVPFYGLLGLQHWLDLEKKARFEALWKGAALFASFLFVFGFLAPYFMDLETARDAQFVQNGFFIDQLVSDRRALITSSATRSLVMGLLVGGALYLWHIEKLKQLATFAIIGVVALTDLWTFDRDQLETDDFLSKRQWESQYAANPANEQIQQDKDPHFRVWNTLASLTSDSYTSYHHKSIGGYHGAKLQRYQDLIDNQLNKQNMACFNMLNAKWVITQGQNGKPQAQRNVQACGNAWSVSKIEYAANADAEMAALSNFDPKQTAILSQGYASALNGKTDFGSASIKLTTYDPKFLEYSFEGDDAFVVFSEIYYEGSGNDWQAYIDGEAVDHLRVNYLLRGLQVPAGKHTITFEFAPKSYYMGRKINFAGSGILLLLLGWMGWKQRKEA